MNAKSVFAVDSDSFQGLVMFRPVLRIYDILVRIKVFLLTVFLFEGTFTSFFKYKKSKRIHKTIGINVFFLLFLLDDRRIKCCGTGTGTVGTVTFCRVDPEPEPLLVKKSEPKVGIKV
jgi:hypothetical protein